MRDSKINSEASKILMTPVNVNVFIIKIVTNGYFSKSNLPGTAFKQFNRLGF